MGVNQHEEKKLVNERLVVDPSKSSKTLNALDILLRGLLLLGRNKFLSSSKSLS